MAFEAANVPLIIEAPVSMALECAAWKSGGAEEVTLPYRHGDMSDLGKSSTDLMCFPGVCAGHGSCAQILSSY